MRIILQVLIKTNK